MFGQNGNDEPIRRACDLPWIRRRAGSPLGWYSAAAGGGRRWLR